MKILVEDSGAGFEVWKLINKNVFGKYFDVIDHHTRIVRSAVQSMTA